MKAIEPTTDNDESRNESDDGDVREDSMPTLAKVVACIVAVAIFGLLARSVLQDRSDTSPAPDNAEHDDANADEPAGASGGPSKNGAEGTGQEGGPTSRAGDPASGGTGGALSGSGAGEGGNAGGGASGSAGSSGGGNAVGFGGEYSGRPPKLLTPTEREIWDEAILHVRRNIRGRSQAQFPPPGSAGTSVSRRGAGWRVEGYFIYSATAAKNRFSCHVQIGTNGPEIASLAFDGP